MKQILAAFNHQEGLQPKPQSSGLTSREPNKAGTSRTKRYSLTSLQTRTLLSFFSHPTASLPCGWWPVSQQGPQVDLKPVESSAQGDTWGGLTSPAESFLIVII